MEDKYKQYQKRKEETIKERKKREEHWHQPELPFYGNTKEEFYSHVSKKAVPKALSEEDVTDLFWDHLVQVGWRFDNEPGHSDTLVLLCQKCEEILDRVYTNGVGSLRPVSSLKNPKALSEHKCKAIPKA